MIINNPIPAMMVFFDSLFFLRGGLFSFGSDLSRAVDTGSSAIGAFAGCVAACSGRSLGNSGGNGLVGWGVEPITLIMNQIFLSGIYRL
ncbi:MAG: hypothetical protein ABII10_00610 [Candidatus Paceibacterota bacterium]